MQKNYPNIIFDLGGVIINLDYWATVRKFSELCGRDMTESYSQKKQDPIFDDLEVGRIQPQEFRDGLRRIFEFEATDEQIDEAWNAMLLDIPKERIELLKELGKNKRIFLLSNTNAIHKPVFEQILLDAVGLPKLDSLFENSYYSHEVGDRKPHTSIFEYVVNENGLNPSETLFIDDSIQHIEGARKAGLNAYHLTGSETILDLFANQPI